MLALTILFIVGLAAWLAFTNPASMEDIRDMLDSDEDWL